MLQARVAVRLAVLRDGKRLGSRILLALTVVDGRSLCGLLSTWGLFEDGLSIRWRRRSLEGKRVLVLDLERRHGVCEIVNVHVFLWTSVRRIYFCGWRYRSTR